MSDSHVPRYGQSAPKTVAFVDAASAYACTPAASVHAQQQRLDVTGLELCGRQSPSQARATAEVLWILAQ